MRELLESEERFRQLAGAIHEVFSMSDADMTTVLYISPAYEAIWGRTCESLIAHPLSWLAAVHPDDRARVGAAVVAAKQGVREDTYRIVRPDDEIRWIRSRTFPVHDENGRVTRLACVSEDITDRRRLEEQLSQTRKLESIGLLAGGVAHDFNNLLTVVGTCADELHLALPADAPERELVGELREATARGAALTRQLLAFSRKQVLEPRLIDLNTVVTETDKLLRRLLGEHVVLTTVLGPGLRPILADPGQITQVLMNLAINARDAMPRGGSLQITTRSAGREVVLIFADTGSGMPEEVRARVFEPFFTTKGAGLGTGLGLSVSHGIIAQSGGHIEVASAPGKGTTFTIHLPIADRKAIRSATHAVVGDLRGTETLLVVEDQAAVRRGIVRILRSRGYRVMEADDGVAALLTLETYGDAIDLVVTDMVMPEMGGRELAESAALRWPELPFLFTTGYTTEAIIKRGELQTEIPFLYKPFSADALLSRVRGVLNASDVQVLALGGAK